MNKEKFRLNFYRALDRAIADCPKSGMLPESRPDKFEVHAPGPQGRIVPEGEMIDAIFVSEELFYKIIDVGIILGEDPQPVGFVRVSGHSPITLEATFDPQDLGPFKSIGASMRRK